VELHCGGLHIHPNQFLFSLAVVQFWDWWNWVEMVWQRRNERNRKIPDIKALSAIGQHLSKVRTVARSRNPQTPELGTVENAIPR